MKFRSVVNNRGKHGPSLTFIQALSSILKTCNSFPWSSLYLLYESLETLAISHRHCIFSKYYSLIFPLFLKDRNSTHFFCCKSQITRPNIRTPQIFSVLSMDKGMSLILASFFDNSFRHLQCILSDQMVTHLLFQLSIHPLLVQPLRRSS